MKNANVFRYISYIFSCTIFICVWFIIIKAQNTSLPDTKSPLNIIEIPDNQKKVKNKNESTQKDEKKEITYPTDVVITPPIQKGPFSWQELVTNDDFLAFSIPTDSNVVTDKEEIELDPSGRIKISEWTTVISYLNDVSLTFETYKTKNANDAMNYLVTTHFPVNDNKVKCYKLKFGEVQSMQCQWRKPTTTIQALYFLGKDAVYVAMSISANENNPFAKRFFLSLQLKPTKPEEINEELREVTLVEENKIYKHSEVEQKAVIVWKPIASYTEEARMRGVQGLIRIQAILGADGKVKQIIPLQMLKYGLTERALSAAKRVRFFPAQKDGKRVSQWVTFEFNFRLF